MSVIRKIDSALGIVLAEKRRELGLSQEDLGFECSLHRTYISQIERGLKSPTVRVLFVLATALKTKPSNLLRRVEARF